MSHPEPNPPDASPSPSGYSRAGLILVFLLFLYPLSVAPVMKFTGQKHADTIRPFYAPVEFLYDRIPAVAQFYDWYFKLWGVE